MSSSSLPFPRKLVPFLIPCLLATRAAALFQTGFSSAIQDGLINTPPTTCPVAQDGSTSNTFPWTHNPTCVQVVLPSDEDRGHIGTHQDFCVYTNTAFNNGRGLSLVTTPEVAAELTSAVFEAFADDSVGQDAWEMKEVYGKGMGLFAKRKIKEGETLILKSPVLFVAREALTTPSRGRRHLLLQTAVDQLPERTKELFMGLSRRGGGNEIEDVINVNSVRVKVWEGTSHLIVVPEAARINHACRQNSYYRFDDYTLNFDVFTLREIRPGEELTFSYGFSNLPRDSRLDALETHWGFTCTCPLCSGNKTTVGKSDERLQKISGIKAVLPTEFSDLPQHIAILPSLISLMEEEGLVIELPMYEEILGYAWSALGIEDRAKYWAGRARRHWEVLAGVESWEAKRTGELEADVKGHGTWMTYDEDPWEGVGKGHPWDDHGDGHEHEHEHEHDHDHDH